jgi:hypothetical protein
MGSRGLNIKTKLPIKYGTYHNMARMYSEERADEDGPPNPLYHALSLGKKPVACTVPY